MTTIDGVEAWEVLDSRGDPTVRVRITAGGHAGLFSVPAGASTGTHEAVERRDGEARYRGRGVRGAVRAVREDLAPVVEGRDVTAQRTIDEALVAKDGTANLERLGGNAVLGVSGAVAHTAAALQGRPLYDYLAADSPGGVPLPMVNILSGGLHATGGIEIQDFLVIPVGASSFPAAVEMAWAVRQAVRDRIIDRGERPLVADEGGFAPPFDSITEAFELLTAGVRDAGFDLEDEIVFAVDVAATHFYEDGEYVLASLDRSLDTRGMIDLVVDWVADYPVVSVEDPLTEDDWAAWSRLNDELPGVVQVLGDDLIATGTRRLERGIRQSAANAVLVKPNQAGTLSRTFDVISAAQDAGWGTVVSARSGETCDTTIADLAVAWDGGQIKIGSLARSERLAKYNRLLAIARSHTGMAGSDRLTGTA